MNKTNLLSESVENLFFFSFAPATSAVKIIELLIPDRLPHSPQSTIILNFTTSFAVFCVPHAFLFDSFSIFLKYTA